MKKLKKGHHTKAKTGHFTTFCPLKGQTKGHSVTFLCRLTHTRQRNVQSGLSKPN